MKVTVFEGTPDEIKKVLQAFASSLKHITTVSVDKTEDVTKPRYLTENYPIVDVVLVFILGIVVGYMLFQLGKG